jgi:hypothetical protein
VKFKLQATWRIFLDENSGMNELNETTKTPIQPSPMVAWFLRGDKYLHEDSHRNRNSHIGIGALLYICVFIINEFVWHFTPHTGFRNIGFFLPYLMLIFTLAFVSIIISRRILFGKNDQQPDPAIGLPDQTTPRLDYQNVIPPYKMHKWLIKRFAAYASLLCGLIVEVEIGWMLAGAIAMPYFMLQK